MFNGIMVLLVMGLIIFVVCEVAGSIEEIKDRLKNQQEELERLKRQK